MKTGKTVLAAVLLTACLAVGTLAGGGRPSLAARLARPEDQLALLQLQSDFHGANTLQDYELMYSLWADDAVVNAAGSTFTGPAEISDFFSSNWGAVQSASLVPSYKTNYQIVGKTATLQFECVIVNTTGQDPIATPLSTIPFGAQIPSVEIVQHSTATCTAVKRGNRWVLKTFNGSAGPF